jgi:ABC-type Fe3+/spermidine/putrescine transport system ATPase subunit
MAKHHYLALNNIQKEYEGQPLLKGISLEVHSGEVLCLLGRSGSGKSTLLRIIAGIEQPDSGSVLWDGAEITGVPTHVRHFGLMFQDYALFPHKNVAENVAFGLRMQNKSKTEISEKVKAALEKVNMQRFAERRVTDLSGGEQQRVALARALAAEPGLLMLDEPLAALDRALREQLQQELRQVLHDSGIPAIYVTHDQDEALALGDRMALLNEGNIVQSGKPEDLFRRPANRWAAQFLGMNNIYPGKVLSTAPFLVETEFGKFPPGQVMGSPCEVGQNIWLVLPSSWVKFTGGNEQKPDLSGYCRECHFKGDHYQVEIVLHNGALFIFNSDHCVVPNEVVSLILPAENSICLKE